jgi:hypothetical protein
MRVTLLAAAAVCLLAAVPAQASDTQPCAKGMVCASAPETIVAALKAAGGDPKLDKDDNGDPLIDDNASGYDFTIYFFECDDQHKNCGSLEFVASFKADPTNTAELANEWNQVKRFAQMSVDSDKTLNFRYDVSTFHGLNADNFSDVIDWWATMLDELSKFFDAHPVPDSAAPAADADAHSAPA